MTNIQPAMSFFTNDNHTLIEHSNINVSLISEGIGILNALAMQRTSVHHQFECGIIDAIGVSNEIMSITKKEQTIKKKLVSQFHITNTGESRTIKYNESKKLYETILPGKSRLYGKTQEILIDKLFDYYGLNITDTTIKSIFEMALAHKDRTESVNQDTLYHLRSTYDRFIDETMANTPIKSITCELLSEYTLKTLRNAQSVDKQGVLVKVKKKAFLDYKTVLNVIFDYAMLKDIINVNPLAKFKNKAFLKECDCSKAISEEKIFSEAELDNIKETVRSYMKLKRYNGYFINGYAILLSIETGMRAGELPSLKWTDIKDNYIHIHSQQLSNKRKGGKEYYYADWTKDEKGESQGGRKFPLTNTIRELLDELKKLQEARGVVSDFIFCHEDGEWIKKDAYITCLRRMLTSMGYDITNNHAFRMSLNSNVLAGKLNLPVAKRAELLGHSVETNLKYYTYASKEDMDDLVERFNSSEVSPRSHLKVVEFTKKESLESSKFKAFS